MAALLEELGRPALTDDPAPQLSAFTEYLADSARALFVAESEGRLAGVASVWVRRRLNWATSEAWISDLYVRPAFRRHGIGKGLLSACLDLARDRGCHVIRLECGFEREEAHALYDTYGFERRGYDFRLSLR